jgi:hypothetical protein
MNAIGMTTALCQTSGRTVIRPGTSVVMASRISVLAQRGLILFLILFAAACTREPTDQELRPPTSWSLGWERAFADARSGAARMVRASADSTMHYLQEHRLPAETAPLLAATIRFSKAQAAAEDVREIPDHVRKVLAPYFGEDLLDEVHWTLPDRRPGLGSLLAGWYFRSGGAVTLGDIVVVSDGAMADNVWLWAHELTHVQQYRRLGLDGFARAYVADWRSLEDAANQHANAITRAIRMQKRCQADASCGTRRV